jgi:hypothetical protein
MSRPLFLTALLLAPVPAHAQGNPPARPQAEEGAEEEIVVTGQRARGAALGEIKPEVTLGSGDIRSLGVGSVTEILAELAPQIRGTGGGQPLILLEGHRISGRQEIERIPAEAIARVDVLPEQVAIKYGYPATQKVVNFVLRKRFRAWTLEGRSRFATGGGAFRGNGSANYFSVRNGARLTLGAEYTGTEMLTEAQRDIAGTGRSLIASEQEFLLNAGYARSLADRLSAAINGSLTTDRKHALLDAAKPRTVNGESAHLGTTVNLDGRRWRGTWTASFDHDEARTIASVSGPGAPADRTRSNTDVLATDLTMNGGLVALPAGDIAFTGRIGGSTSSYDSASTRPSAISSASATALSRSLALGAVSLDVPVLDSPSRFIGAFSINGNAEVQTLSDFGTLRSFGYGFSWSPVKAVSLIASYKDAESAPTMQQLGGPVLPDGLVRVYDYVRGATALVSYTTGGNPALARADVREWRLGANVKALDKPSLSFSVNYTGTRTDNGIAALPAATAASGAAFPGRFVRDGAGNLIAVDARPVNIAHQRSDVLRWGINFSKTLKTPQAQIDAMRAYMKKRFPGGPPGVGMAQGMGRGGGGGGGSRLSFSLYHSIHLAERATLLDGQPEIDLLDGGTLSGGAPQPRHEVEVQAGYSRGWLGARLTGNWQSATHVRDPGGLATGNLRFSSLATANLRLFVNLGQIPSVLRDHPFLFGTRLSVGINNILNQRQHVTDGTGSTPPAYSAAQLDPLGRTITFSLRKLLF